MNANDYCLEALVLHGFKGVAGGSDAGVNQRWHQSPWACCCSCMQVTAHIMCEAAELHRPLRCCRAKGCKKPSGQKLALVGGEILANEAALAEALEPVAD